MNKELEKVLNIDNYKLWHVHKVGDRELITYYHGTPVTTDVSNNYASTSFIGKYEDLKLAEILIKDDEVYETGEFRMRQFRLEDLEEMLTKLISEAYLKGYEYCERVTPTNN